MFSFHTHIDILENPLHIEGLRVSGDRAQHIPLELKLAAHTHAHTKDLQETMRAVLCNFASLITSLLFTILGHSRTRAVLSYYLNLVKLYLIR